ncbi:hypothetical protein TRV_02058 [Trichophyton verrucosum HKI 0517]|uniref:Uncharacterized protein n=1 Tax=Trichophyton verrucosum (strain HKI 0517) TaxID=663202 RepID=D4D4P2_TRIVH|nr:uncharacterized protein TRV_02058 [Trichophyton verrucosum HKI 0517]EFE43177.1 hypothetical protein TRV_02058 [Trichophyton verrucosum HKI 0517]
MLIHHVLSPFEPSSSPFLPSLGSAQLRQFDTAFSSSLQLQLRATFLLLIIILSSATSKRKKKYARWSVKKATLYGVPHTPYMDELHFILTSYYLSCELSTSLALRSIGLDQERSKGKKKGERKATKHSPSSWMGIVSKGVGEFVSSSDEASILALTTLYGVILQPWKGFHCLVYGTFHSIILSFGIAIVACKARRYIFHFSNMTLQFLSFSLRRRNKASQAARLMVEWIIF